MQTKLIEDRFGELTFSHHLPPLLATYSISGSVPAVASASFGSVLWQEIACNGITIRVQHYLLTAPCNFTCTEERPVLKLLFHVSNHIRYQIDGLGSLTFYEHAYNLLYLPDKQNRLHFPQEGIYSCIEIFYPEHVLLKLQASFPFMTLFLKRVQKQQAAMLMPVNQMSSQALLDLIKRLLPALHHTVDKMFLRNRAIEILAQCLDDMSQRPLLQPARLPLEEANLIYFARTLLIEHAGQNWTMKKLTEKTGLNHYQLESGFQQLYGRSPAGFLREVRMEKAWHLLPGKKYSVSQVAEMVGYTNLSAFSKAFRKYYRITARQRSKE